MQKSTKRNAQGGGSLRQLPSGRWQGRYTVGRDPGTGRQIQKSVYADTQQECRKLMIVAIAALDEGIYLEPSKMTVSAWLDTWVAEYTSALKPYTLRNYKSQIKNHIKPYLGAIKVSELSADMIQRTYNRLSASGLSPKTLRNIHGILHKSLETLVEIGELRNNPCLYCKKYLPKVEHKDFTPLVDDSLPAFIHAIEGSEYENLFLVDLFTGLRQGELLGLRWSCVDFKKQCIKVDKQLYMPGKGGAYSLETLKNRKVRIIHPAPFVFEVLKRERRKQIEAKLAAGVEWDTGGFPDSVFTNSTGGHLSHKTVYKQFKSAVEASGVPAVRFHDMRHSYAVASIRSGDDIKTVQQNLGHATAAFTLDQYGHVTETMKAESARRMQEYIESIPK